jgi:spore coat polysaccharide biosynthesis protein SpsF
MGSTRLPNKMMMYFHGLPICEWVYKRVAKSKKLNSVVFAISDNKRDDILEIYLNSLGVDVFRGSEDDLVDRFYNTAHSVFADRIVRICADNPLLCPDEIDRLISFFDSNKCDYAYNHIPNNNNYPDGLGAEICSIDILDKIYKLSKSKSHREHLFNYILDNRSDYSIKTFDAPNSIAYPQIKLDIDTMNDYQKLLSYKFSIDMKAPEIIETILKNN